MGLIVLWLYSDVRLITDNAPSSIADTIVRPVIRLARSSDEKKPSEKSATNVVTTTGNANAMIARIQWTVTVRSLIHSARSAWVRMGLPSDIPGCRRWP